MNASPPVATVSLFHLIHPLGRLFFALGWFASVLLLHRNIALLLGVLSASIVLLRWQLAMWRPILRAARLLLWLLIPILLLHLLFTPGQLLWPESGLDFTREGLQAGTWLALHLCALFYAAMLLSRSLTREEWAYYCLNLPVLGQRLLPFVKLAPPMHALADRAVAEARLGMSLKAGWRSAVHFVVALSRLVEHVWHGAGVEARRVWEQWERSGEPQRPTGNRLAGLLLALCGLLMPLLVGMGQ